MIVLNYRNIRLPWFRVHIIVLNDPGRLISVHMMHTAILCSWSSLIFIYELIVLDISDPSYNPFWRQGCYVLPFMSRIGSTSSIFGWSISMNLYINLWSYESISVAHLILSRIFILASLWHWSYFDLNVFVHILMNELVLDLNNIFAIHLNLAWFISYFYNHGSLNYYR